jgi:hypothetical protein
MMTPFTISRDDAYGPPARGDSAAIDEATPQVGIIDAVSNLISVDVKLHWTPVRLKLTFD